MLSSKYGGAECADEDPALPAGSELPEPNGVDDDCDGRVDDGTAVFDDDGDGFSEREGDCDDADATRWPNALELPDCRDQDCDGQVDDGLTRPETDDEHEPNDTPEQATDTRTAGMKKFRRTLHAVSRDEADPEWFSFYSHDGWTDQWGLEAEILQGADGARYDVAFYRVGELFEAKSLREGERMVVTGWGSGDATGTWQVRLTPRGVPAWCPVTFALESR